jgi:hypothetical protein
VGSSQQSSSHTAREVTSELAERSALQSAFSTIDPEFVNHVLPETPTVQRPGFNCHLPTASRATLLGRLICRLSHFLVDELCHKVVLAPDEPELEAALGELQSALQEYRDYLESVAADCLFSLPLAIRKRLSKLHETIDA